MSSTASQKSNSLTLCRRGEFIKFFRFHLISIASKLDTFSFLWYTPADVNFLDTCPTGDNAMDCIIFAQSLFDSLPLADQEELIQLVCALASQQ